MIFAQIGRIATQFRGSRRELDRFPNAFHSSAVNILGQKSCKHQDWFDEKGEEITVYTRHIKMILAQYPVRQTTTHFYDYSRIRDMLDSWLKNKAEEIQYFADNNDMNMFNDALKSSGNTLMTDKDVLNRRAKLIVFLINHQ